MYIHQIKNKNDTNLKTKANYRNSSKSLSPIPRFLNPKE